MDASPDAVAAVSRSRVPLLLVVGASIVYVIVAAGLTVAAIVGCVDRARAAARGAIPLDFDPGIWIREPSDASFFGAPYVVPGSVLHITGASGTVHGVPVSAVVLMGIGGIVADLTGIGIAVCVGVLGYRMLRGAPFARATSRTLVVLALVVMIGFEAQPLLDTLGRSAIVPSIAMSEPQQSSGTFFASSSNVLFSFTPIYIGLALLGLAAVFRYGAVLQRETEGLV